jgi:hypothetical protein
MRKIFELDAARPDAEPGITALWKGLDVTAIDGTTMELARRRVRPARERRRAAAAGRRARAHRQQALDRAAATADTGPATSSTG